jgi:hypothetical protein
VSDPLRGLELGELARDRMDRTMPLAHSLDERGRRGERDEGDERGDQSGNHCLSVPCFPEPIRWGLNW